MLELLPPPCYITIIDNSSPLSAAEGWLASLPAGRQAKACPENRRAVACKP